MGKRGRRGCLWGPRMKVWDLVRGKVLNVGGANFDEVKPGCWRLRGEV